jgi:hypothetical protein
LTFWVTFCVKANAQHSARQIKINYPRAKK